MISLEAATRTCKVDTASAARIESDRFLNPNNVMCPVWQGVDIAGRTVCPDSFYTKRAGCNSAADRVIVENQQRPQYFEYINLSDEGIRADIYKNNMYFQDAGTANAQLDGTQRYTGSFNLQPAGQFESTCGPTARDDRTAYDKAQGQVTSQIARNTRGRHVVEGYTEPQQYQRTNTFAQRNSAMTNGYRSCRFRNASGM
jgi:hypothetical protein